ncbi:MAG: HAD-IA family hydrolase [Deferrisomatales bacterium]|nr:HAD-IA family hydrolase [Deferrisomatales bacterium]
MGPIRGVLFDAGNTLIRVRGSVGAVYAEVARRHGLHADAGALEEGFRKSFRQRKEGFLQAVSRPHSPERERAWWRGLVEEVFRDAGSRDGLRGRFDSFFEELYREFEESRHWQTFPDVLPCLEALAARGLPLGVLSNWDSRLHPVLRGLGLTRRFRFVLTSAELGAEKPDAAIFLEGARRLGRKPAEVLYVGDLLREDVFGAARAGLRGMLLDREGSCPAPVPRIEDLRKLPAALDAA